MHLINIYNMTYYLQVMLFSVCSGYLLSLTVFYRLDLNACVDEGRSRVAWWYFAASQEGGTTVQLQSDPRLLSNVTIFRLTALQVFPTLGMYSKGKPRGITS